MESVHFTAPLMVTTVGIAVETWYLVKHGHKFEKNDQKDKDFEPGKGEGKVIDKIAV